ncbi:hypothetical protein BDZ91DRAFT_380208 [Kalaharituber pfeilii]|nr:hypothetical protein BDZ91DRAFT_380208 [Kalaharituber pfeilii]
MCHSTSMIEIWTECRREKFRMQVRKRSEFPHAPTLQITDICTLLSFLSSHLLKERTVAAHRRSEIIVHFPCCFCSAWNVTELLTSL